MLIVESLQTKKRIPAYAHDKVVSLGDIAIYTSNEEIPLSNVFETIYKQENKALDASLYKTTEQLNSFFEKILGINSQSGVILICNSLLFFCRFSRIL